MAAAIHCSSQSHAELKSELVYYQGQKIFNGKKTNLICGSGQKKDLSLTIKRFSFLDARVKTRGVQPRLL
jgi:hypothetical protein